MDDDPRTRAAPSKGLPAWLGPLLIALVVCLGYCIAPTRLPLVGEETCRALHGIEMAASGDWLIATNQGVAIIDRPPLQYWTLALVHAFVHALDPLTLRLFMALVTLATALLAWWYARRVFGELAGLVAGLAYPTFGHVVSDLGRRVEAEGLFTLLLAGALLVWHAGYARRWRPLAYWTAGAALAALAALTKGLQAPVAFFGATWLFLLLRRDLRAFASVGHLAGWGVFLGLIAAWQIPFTLVTEPIASYATWLQPGTSRVDFALGPLVAHLGLFPVEVLAALLPWSLLLPALALAGVRRGFEGERREALVFLACAALALLGPLWITAGASTRYAMPFYPLAAVLCGAVAERALATGTARLWRGALRALAALVAAVGLALVAVSASYAASDAPELGRYAQGGWLSSSYLLAALGTGWLLWRLAGARSAGSAGFAAFSFASFLALLGSGPILDTKVRVAVEIGPEVQALHERLPADARLVSFGPLHHKFVYWYGEPIPILALPERAEDLPPEVEYFALDVRSGAPVELSFAFEELARLSMDRKRKTTPDIAVVVGRRLRED